MSTVTNYDFTIAGTGAWGPSFRNWSDLQRLLNGESLEDDGSKGPKPEAIPANERRRAPLPVRLAVETSWQASQEAGIDPKELCSVFVSGLGDTQLTDYMCRVLAGDNMALSPTKFHNSVHNAAAGYWTISTGCMEAANSVAGFAESVSLTIMEALIQSSAEQRPILLTFYDAPSSAVLKELLKNEQPFAVSLVIAPAAMGFSGVNMTAEVQQQQAPWPEHSWPGDLQHCYDNNPVARVLPLLNLLSQRQQGKAMSTLECCMPLSAATSLNVRVGN